MWFLQQQTPRTLPSPAPTNPAAPVLVTPPGSGGHRAAHRANLTERRHKIHKSRLAESRAWGLNGKRLQGFLHQHAGSSARAPDATTAVSKLHQLQGQHCFGKLSFTRDKLRSAGTSPRVMNTHHSSIMKDLKFMSVPLTTLKGFTACSNQQNISAHSCLSTPKGTLAPASF